jgi:catalase
MSVLGNSGVLPNYPSSFCPLDKPRAFAPTQEFWTGRATNFQFGVTDEDFVQLRALWEVLGRTARQQDNTRGLCPEDIYFTFLLVLELYAI